MGARVFENLSPLCRIIPYEWQTRLFVHFHDACDRTVEACMYRLSLSVSVNIDLDHGFLSAKGLLSMSFSRSGGAHIELDSSLGDEEMSKKRSS